MKEKFKWKNIATIFVTAILFFCAPIVVWLVISTKSKIGFIEEKYLSVWIGFYGSIIGGIITFFGVWWTISSNEKDRKEDIKNSYLPIPVIYSICSSEEAKYFWNCYEKTFEVENVSLCLKNIGKGPMLKITYDNDELFFMIHNNKKYLPSNYGGYYKQAIDKNEEYKIIFPPITIPLDMSEVSEKNCEIYYLTHINYSDAFHRENDLYIKVTFVISKNKQCSKEYTEISEVEFNLLKEYSTEELVNKVDVKKDVEA